MEIIMTDQSGASNPKSTSKRPGAFSFVGRAMSWLFSHEHFYIKLLSGTVAGVIVIILLGRHFSFSSPSAITGRKRFGPTPSM